MASPDEAHGQRQPPAQGVERERSASVRTSSGSVPRLWKLSVWPAAVEGSCNSIFRLLAPSRPVLLAARLDGHPNRQ